jgi:hypothetical protein
VSPQTGRQSRSEQCLKNSGKIIVTLLKNACSKTDMQKQTSGWLQIARRCQLFLTNCSQFVENIPPAARSEQSRSESSSFPVSPIYSPLVAPHAFTAQFHVSDTHTHEVSKLMYTSGNTDTVCYFILVLSLTLKLQHPKVSESNRFGSFV